MSASQSSEATRMLNEVRAYIRRPVNASLPRPLEDPYPQQTLLLFPMWASIRHTVGLDESGPSFLGPPLNFLSVAGIFREVGPWLVSPFSRLLESFLTCLSFLSRLVI
jgi:hypothetical protein